jgi:hypothetical protein
MVYEFRAATTLDGLIHPAFNTFLVQSRIADVKFVHRTLAPLATGDTLAEVRTNYTHLFAGAIAGGAPDQIDCASTSADDNEKTITRFGIDENDDLLEETTTIADQASTGVVAFKRLNDAKLSAASVGTVTLSEDGATTKTYATIAASATDSVNTRFYFPDGKRGIVLTRVALLGTHAAAGLLATDAAFVRVGHSAATGQNQALRLINNGSPVVEVVNLVEGDNDTYLNVQVQSIDTGVAVPVCIEQLMLVG